MKSEEFIEKLFEGEEIPDASRRAALPLISVPPPDDDAAIKKLKEIERREFSRAEVGDQKLELKFLSGAQFARQYIENISLGGVFVKTDQKLKMGDSVPIEFTIPSGSKHRIFKMKAKVCRVSADGVGLEFLNLSADERSELETFVRSVLPKDTPVVAKAKAGSIERLQKLRDNRASKVEKQKKRISAIIALTFLLCLNIYLGIQRLEVEVDGKSIKNHSLLVKGKSIPLKSIRSIQKSERGEWTLKLTDKSSISVRPQEIEGQLPNYLHQSIQLLKTTPVRKEMRRSINTRGLSDLHR